MQKLTLTVALLCAWAAFPAALAQDAPIELSQQVNTTYYTDGSSKSNARLLFSVDGGNQQPLGFMGKRLKRI